MKHILDNPIYNSLATAHHKFAKSFGQTNHYLEDIASFAGLKNNSAEDLNELYKNSVDGNLFIVFSIEQLQIPEKWKLITHIDMHQMVYDSVKFPEESSDYFDLNENHVQEMIALVDLTKPGPFKSRTIDLGNYTGIFDGEKLISMAGNRFNPAPYMEISAVCTHPDYLGKGYSKSIMNEQVKRIILNNQIPFLHVKSDNLAAIKLYEKVGFKFRTEMTAYVISR
ncbi:GNAT family N-acetyltransferase [Pedobacter aquatilis]|uniref:GNAT family N-acetyltransferase n=1 Tax=Pedobacter aquatilis TaxID=351343 RepID=UPI00292F3EA9|nr:GNAT family N-acetyltransferase [Pedobacter aquatilis]